MRVQITKSYNDAPHFSTRDSFYEAVVNDVHKVRFVQCDDKNSSHLGEIELLEVNGNIMDLEAALLKAGLNEDVLLEELNDAVDNFR